jgi:hypothetical protein
MKCWRESGDPCARFVCARASTMNPWLQVLIELVKIGGTLCAAWLAALFAIQKFHKEKAWERKEKSYTEIIEALHTCTKHAEMASFATGEDEAHFTKLSMELWPATKTAVAHLDRIVETGGWYVSQEVLKVLMDYKKERMELRNAEEHGHLSLDESGQHEAAFLTKALGDVRALAMDDLRATKSWKVWRE